MTSNLVNFTSEEVNNNNDESKKAIETIETSSTTAEIIEEEIEQSVYTLNDTFKIVVNTPEEWLCVARLPLDFTETEFETLLQDYGPVEQCFLIHSEISGTSKGYGLVKYENKASSIQARHVLEGHQVRNGHVLDCDYLKHNRQQITSLHSKCLYVDQLPPDYRDMAQFRRLFSKVVNPPYCQIAIKNGMIHNWGLVEFQSSQEAEATIQALQGETIEGHNIRVQFCIPGVHAINIYMSFVNNPMDAVAEKKALLEETPSSKVYEQLNSLAKHNPWFVANLQNIMAGSAFNSTPTSTASSQSSAVATKPMLKPIKANMSTADPAQAALILLLAGKVSKGSQDQNNALFQGIVKQMTNGVNATEILRSIIKPQQHEDLIQAAINMAMLEDSASKAAVAQQPQQPQKQQPKSDKCPLLTELLYKSFQARLAKEQRLKALKEQQESSQAKASNPLAQMVVNSQQQLTTSAMTVAASEAATLAPNFLGAAPNTDMLSIQQPQMSSYPQLFYYSQMLNPNPMASMWPQYHGATTLLPTPQPQQSLMIPNMMHLANGQAAASAAQVGIKRAAPPVMYGNMEKRMKLA